MTPERLAECPHTNLWWAGCVSCGASFQDIIAAQRAHIRDLEAQVAAAQEALALAYLELGDGGHPGFREANRAAMTVYERYFDHYDPTGKTIHELREAALVTATPPPPPEAAE